MSATAWTLGSQPLSMVLQLGRSLLLTRLLFPEAFGLMALVNVVLVGMKMFSDLGVNAAVVQSSRSEDERFVQTAWTLQVLRGLLLAVATVAVASPAAAFFSEPLLEDMLAVAAVSLAITGFGSLTPVLRQREVNLAGVTVFRASVELFSTLLTIGLAWWMRDVWALVYGAVASSLLTSGLSHLVFHGTRHRIRWHGPSARQLISFGQWVFLSTLFTFLAQQAWTLVLGRLSDAEILGIVAVAAVLSGKALQLCQKLAESVLFPVVSELTREDPQWIERKVRKARSAILDFATVAGSGVAMGAPWFFLLLYDPRYADAGWIARLQVLVLWFHVLNRTSGSVLLGLADTRMLAVLNGLRAFGAIGGRVVGFYIAGIPGFILFGAIAPITTELLTLWKLKRWRIDLRKQDLTLTMRYALIAGIGIGIDFGLLFLLEGRVETVARIAGCGLYTAIIMGLLGRSIWLPKISTIRARHARRTQYPVTAADK